MYNKKNLLFDNGKNIPTNIINRVAIYVYYDVAGKLNRDALWQLRELKKCVNHLIVVVNGKLNDFKELDDLADRIIIRENVGLDAAAYKCALLDEECNEVINSSDELVFCNNTFYGPFDTFEPIFDKMKEDNNDFWGMAYLDYGFMRCLESFFLVFRKRIIEDGVLISYFNNKINDRTNDISEICLDFEMGLFEDLISNGYSYSAYTNTSHWIHRDVIEIIKDDKLPLIKKKAFSEKYYNPETMYSALKYVDSYYDFDINIILNSVENLFGIKIKKYDIKTYKRECICNPIKVPKSRDELINFIQNNSDIYIYGNGLFAKYILKFLVEEKNKIRGFIISDNQNKIIEKYDSISIYKWSELNLEKEMAIVVALNEENTVDVLKVLEEYKNIFKLWN